MYVPPNPRVKGLKALRNEARKRHEAQAQVEADIQATRNRAAIRKVVGA